ncbi:hypothetical protein A3L09_07950 [Thermococcus profundus]|uniref:KaiC-like domain-containing protein n=1 Tax=Thermococcus profundus TaxID=49899 RepID=A0A2Z2MCG7_THEPR|nr:hypothetical protein [Thermococcus profundus]ASJ03189.1 hypothetical protein A3L09_07950 [Thermococcus profundus]
MTLVFHTPDQSEEVKPFEGFPLGIRQGSSSAVLFSDELSEVFLVTYLEAALLEGGSVYHVQVGGGFTPSTLRRIKEDISGFHFGKTYRLSSVVEALKTMEPGSSLVVSGFPLLRDRSTDGLLELLEIAGEKDVTLILTHTPIVLNELDLPGEFSSHYLLPELFDYLFVARMSSYRGHYRLNVSLLRAPADFVGNLGEHSIPVDSEIKALL